MPEMMLHLLHQAVPQTFDLIYRFKLSNFSRALLKIVKYTSQ